MARAIGFVLLGVGGWLALSALGGCNEVLDIEQAQLDSAGSTGSGGGAAMLTSTVGSNVCTANNDKCSACIDKQGTCTPGEYGACLGNADCRKSLDRYRICLTKACVAKDCIETLYDVGGAVAAPDCIIDNCAEACKAVPVASACQLYCACMGANCESKFHDGTFTTMDSCIQTCEALPPELQSCRRTHCEIAPKFPAEAHCAHATGFLFCASSNVPATTCTDKSLNSFACEADAECCSGHCDSRKSCQDQ